LQKLDIRGNRTDQGLKPRFVSAPDETCDSMDFVAQALRHLPVDEREWLEAQWHATQV
jgi:hypothetical protein